MSLPSERATEREPDALRDTCQASKPIHGRVRSSAEVERHRRLAAAAEPVVLEKRAGRWRRREQHEESKS